MSASDSTGHPATPATSPQTVVHLVRHGEVHNPEKVLYGRLPGYRLSDRGLAQAAAAAASFEGHDIAALYVSPMLRTQQTAQPISEISGVEIDTREEVIEAGNTFEGLHIKGIDSALWNPKYWPRLRRPSEPSWGEHYEDIADRMFTAIHQAREQAEGREAVIVTHQLCVVAASRRARGLPLAHNPAQRQCDLASVTSLIFQGENLIDVRYAEPARGI